MVTTTAGTYLWTYCAQSLSMQEQLPISFQCIQHARTTSNALSMHTTCKNNFQCPFNAYICFISSPKDRISNGTTWSASSDSVQHGSLLMAILDLSNSLIKAALRNHQKPKKHRKKNKKNYFSDRIMASQVSVCQTIGLFVLFVFFVFFGFVGLALQILEISWQCQAFALPGCLVECLSSSYIHMCLSRSASKGIAHHPPVQPWPRHLRTWPSKI